MKQTDQKTETASILALRVVAFITADESRLSRFMALTGNNAQAVHQGVRNDAFLGGVLDYLLQDESLLFEFSEYARLPVELVQLTRRQLP